MRNRLRSAALAVLATFALAPAARSELLPRDLWDAFVARLSGAEAVAAEESGTAVPEALAFEDVTLTFDLPDWEGTLDLTLGRLRLAPGADGGVEVALPADAEIALSLGPPGAPPLGMRFSLGQTEQILAVTETGARRRAAYDADRLTLGLKELTLDGAPVPRAAAMLELEIERPRARVGWRRDGTGAVTHDLSADALSYEAAAADPDSRIAVAAVGTLTRPSRRDTPELRFDAAEARLAAEGPRGEATLRLDSGPGRTTVAPGPRRFDLRTDAADTALQLDGTELSFPVTAEIGQAELDLSVPVSPSQGPRDAALDLSLDEIRPDPDFRERLDPSGALPTDPGRLALDLRGRVAPRISLYDITALASALRGERPAAALRRLEIDSAELDAAGARATADGTLTAPETAEDDPPAPPEGEIELRLTGADALIGALVDSGAISWWNGAAARLALGYFTTATDEADTVTSTLSFAPDGTIRANGQRIR